MKIKLKDFKHKSDKIFAKAIIKDKEVIKTISLDNTYLVNGQITNSNFRTTYNLIVLDKHDKNFKHGNLVIEYLIFSNVKFRAFIVANFFNCIYLKLLFEHYWFQRMKGVKQIFIGIFIGVVSAVVAGLILNFFTCS
tara:strand:- start:284 stop:694 length:411 start_codon:yes stop_codon:yes gene_type:complete